MNYKIGGCKIINLFKRLIKISLKTKNELIRVNYVGNFKIRRGFERMVSNKPQRPNLPQHNLKTQKSFCPEIS